MEAKDVKVGMKVILNKDARRKDGTNTMPDNSAEWGYRGGKDDGFLLVVRPHSNCYGAQWVLAARDVNHGGDYYNASDFQPATIEVNDVVRRNGVDADAVVVGIDSSSVPYLIQYADKPSCGGHNGELHSRWIYGGQPTRRDYTCAWAIPECLTLVRKAKRVTVPNSEIPKPADTRYRPKKGERVRVLKTDHNDKHIGMVGTVEDECIGENYVCGVRFDDRQYYAVRECEPAPADRRPTVGDWVEIVGSTCGGHQIGTIGKVMDAADIDSLAIEANGKVKYHCRKCYKLTTPPEQKPREFKVGDRVVCTGTTDGRSFYHEFGTIIQTFEPASDRVRVNFDNWRGGHTASCSAWSVVIGTLRHAEEPATVLKSDADAAVRRAFDAGFNDGQKAMKSRITATDIVPNPSKAALAKFWEAD